MNLKLIYPLQSIIWDLLTCLEQFFYWPLCDYSSLIIEVMFRIALQKKWDLYLQIFDMKILLTLALSKMESLSRNICQLITFDFKVINVAGVARISLLRI